MITFIFPKISTLVHPEVFVLFALVWGNVLQGTFSLSQELSHDPERSSAANETDNAFGILHTLQMYGDWAAHEEDIARVLKEKQKRLKVKRQLIQSYLSGYHKLRRRTAPWTTQEKIRKVLGESSTFDYRMANRYASEIHGLRAIVNSADYLDNQKIIREMLGLENGTTNEHNSSAKVNDTSHSQVVSEEEEEFTPWIGWQDMYMSMTALLHILEVYGLQLNASDIRKGVELETDYGGQLHAFHCTQLGMFALYRRKLNAAIEWTELGIRLIESDENNKNNIVTGSWSTMDVTFLKRLYLVAIQQHNLELHKYLRNGETVDRERFFSFYYIDPLTNKTTPEERVSYRKYIYSDYKTDENNLHMEGPFMDLCMGNVIQRPEVQTKLKCYYEQHRHPYLLINPVKVEHLSESPPVFQFYEMVGNRTIELIKEMQVPVVMLSMVMGQTEIDVVTVFRTSAGTGMAQEDTPPIVYSLAEYVTGLNIRGTSEHIQFLEYSYGRYYNYHYDALGGDDEEEVATNGGDRVATILYYLELPKMGGLTPFCQAGVFAHPVKGSAVLWYNMYRNGTPRQDTFHGACPVIHGHKIVMNHWIRYNGNWNTFKCSLNQWE